MLRLFGPARVTGFIGSRPPRMAFVAAAMLDLAPGRSLDRRALAQALWPGHEPQRASGNLREMLSRTAAWQEDSGLAVFRADGRVLFRDPSTVQTDLTLFLHLAVPDSTGGLRWLLELYAGDFLADADPNGEETIQWIDTQRVSLRDRFVALCLQGVRRVGGAIAEQALQRLEQEAPYDDEVAREVMISAARHGAQSARAAFERFSTRVGQELGAEPEASTRALLLELVPTQGQTVPAALASPSGGVTASISSVPRVLILPPLEERAGVATGNALADAMVDEVTYALSRARTFAVFAPHTARQLIRAPFPQGNPYGADYVVRTSLSNPGDNVAWLTVAMTSLSTHEVLLTETVAVSQSDLNDRHVQLATALGSRLAGGIERAERRYYRTTGSASAYVHFLLGSDNIKVLELRSLRRAKSHFRQAMKLSPNFVPARAMVARAHCLEWILLDRRDPEPINQALLLARESVDIDPAEPLALRELGHALVYLDRMDEAVEALHAATDLGPHHADILLNYADGLIHIGKATDARGVMDRALALNPLPPDQYHWISATADYLLGNYAAASMSFGKMRERQAAARFMAAVEAMNGNLPEAHRQRDVYLRSHPDFQLDDYMFPLRRPEDREHVLEGLRRAGFH